jgi:ectoine hydroxylase-related dioxygenase (phytanoyl-CoA dioxygenase family)
MFRSIHDEVEQCGFAIRDAVLSESEVQELLAAMDQVNSAGSVRKRSGIFAVRNLLDVSSDVQILACSPVVRELVAPVLGSECFPVRGILFDKIPGANWKVPWHQDVTIAVQDRIEIDGFGPWSIKADLLHVQPPAVVLENMLSVRLHLDACGEENGALRVIPGSHRHGRIPEDKIPSVRHDIPEKVCAVGVGGALLMRPLLLHASSASRAPEHRRVIHLDFAAVQLPLGMNWFSAQGVQSPVMLHDWS